MDQYVSAVNYTRPGILPPIEKYAYCINEAQTKGDRVGIVCWLLTKGHRFQRSFKPSIISPPIGNYEYCINEAQAYGDQGRILFDIWPKAVVFKNQL